MFESIYKLKIYVLIFGIYVNRDTRAFVASKIKACTGEFDRLRKTPNVYLTEGSFHYI